MIAYKGFTKNLTARLGQGEYQFRQGETFTEESSKTVQSGFHCCENPFECLGYYHLGSSDRFFQVEAAGSIDEDADERIACTELTLIKELGIKEFAAHGMMYIAQHPKREKWQKSANLLKVSPDQAESSKEGEIAIARGNYPKVKGVKGSILGLLLETVPGKIEAAKIVTVGECEIKEGIWYTLSPDRTLQEVGNEEKGN